MIFLKSIAAETARRASTPRVENESVTVWLCRAVSDPDVLQRHNRGLVRVRKLLPEINNGHHETNYIGFIFRSNI